MKKSKHLIEIKPVVNLLIWLYPPIILGHWKTMYRHLFCSPRSIFATSIYYATAFIIIYALLAVVTTMKSYHGKMIGCTNLCPYVGKITRDRLKFDFFHAVRSYPNFVCQPNFRNLADWIYGWPKQLNELIEITTSDGRDIAPCLPHGSIIYVSVWHINDFFNKIYPHLINNFVLITGEGDYASPSDISFLERVDSKIIHWFGQNGHIEASRSKKFTHIPIGLQCYEMAEKLQQAINTEINYTMPSVYHDIDEPAHYIQPQHNTRHVVFNRSQIDRKKLLLINFNYHHDSTGLRKYIWKSMCKSGTSVSFATCVDKLPGVQMNTLADTYSRNRQYSFWLSPPGDGIDCHRTWEALYLDAIPIVWNSSLKTLYDDLPVVVIQNFTEITETFLLEKLQDIALKKYHQMTKVYRFEKLRNAYWRRLILNQSRHALTDFKIRKGMCWRGRFTLW